MDTYIKIYGTEDEVSNQLMQKTDLQEDDTFRLLYFLIHHPDILTPEESVALVPDEIAPQGMTFASEKYYINIKVTTLVLCALFLDITLTLGAASALLSLAGISGKAMIKLSDTKGEKCILRELLRRKNRMGNSRMLEAFSGNCVNHDIPNCKYRRASACGCTPAQVEDILKQLEKNSIITKTDYENYKYSF